MVAEAAGTRKAASCTERIDKGLILKILREQATNEVCAQVPDRRLDICRADQSWWTDLPLAELHRGRRIFPSPPGARKSRTAALVLWMWSLVCSRHLRDYLAMAYLSAAIWQAVEIRLIPLPSCETQPPVRYDAARAGLP